jgi:uncharacterized phage protein gp47/JayE
MSLPTRSFTDIVRDMSASVTSSTGKILDMSVGSIMRALIEANAGIMLWAQWLVALTLRTTRAETSTGSDLDSWMADFAFERSAATPARGTITFSRYSSVMSVVIPVGTAVKCRDRNISYIVIADNTLTSFAPPINAYSIAAGVNSIDVPVAASTPGSEGNVLKESITLLASPVPGIDTVNNNSALSGGEDPESDETFRLRFRKFFAARSRATVDAIGYAIVQAGSDLKYLIQENVDPQGMRRIGNIVIFISSSAGPVSSDTLNAISNSVNLVRPIGTTFFVLPADVVEVQITLTLALPAGLLMLDVTDNIRSSIKSYVNGIPIGGLVSVSRIVQIAYASEIRIVNLSQVMLNSSASDIYAQPHQVFEASIVEFSAYASH